MSKKTIKVIMLILILNILFNNPVLAMNAATPAAEKLAEFTDNFFREKLARHNVPGVAIVIVKDGKIIFSKGYGYANIETKRPVDPKESIFRAASVSKIFTIVGTLQLAEQGLIDIDEDVNRYITSFKVENCYEEPVRIRHLLTHTDGFETRDLATFIKEPKELETLEEILKKNLKSPVQKPGSMITYGGYGTALAGYLITQIQNVPFEEYIEENIFKPLNMENSTFNQNLPNHLKDKVVTTYNYEENEAKFTPTEFLFVRTPPTGALSTTAEDMGRFLIALLNNGKFKDIRIINESTAEMILNRQYSTHPYLPGVTYGFMEHFSNGQRGLVRDGSGVGVRSQIFLLPEHNLGYFYVQNTRGDELIEEFNKAFLDEFFPRDNDIFTAVTSAADLKKYEGNYRPAQTPEHTLVKMVKPWP
jgi:CubicO group peptidase (beta-lactamase class C family)